MNIEDSSLAIFEPPSEERVIEKNYFYLKILLTARVI